MAVNESANLVYVVNERDDTVTYLDATTGAYLNGTLANSTFAVGKEPQAVAVNESASRVYVVSLTDSPEGGSVTYLDATTGGYALAQQMCFEWVPTGPLPQAVAVVPPRGWTLP